MKSVGASFKRASAVGVASSLVSGLVTFAAFRLSVEYVSLAAVGAWALIQGIFVIARVSDIGTGANIVRAISRPLKSGEVPEYGHIVGAGFLLNTAPVALIGVILTPLTAWYVSSQYGSHVGGTTVEVLCFWSLVAGILSSASAVAMSAVEGCFRLAFRNWSTILGNCIGLALAVPLLMSDLGIAALGVLSCTIPLVQLIMSGLLLVRISKIDGPAKNHGFLPMIRSLWQENFKLSAIGICRLTFEPVTKILLSVVAPLAFIAVFELALRASTQIRLTVQAAAQPLLAVGVRDAHGLGRKSRRLFHNSQKRLLATACLSSALVLTAAPIISVLGLGRYEPTFLAVFAALVLSNGINIVGMGGYLYLLSGGELGYLLQTHVAMMFLNVTGGAVGLAFRSPFGIVCAYGATFALGGVMSLFGLKGVVPLRPSRGEMRLARLVILFLASTIFVGSFLAQVFLLPSYETWKTITTSVIACCLLVVLIAAYLKGASARQERGFR